MLSFLPSLSTLCSHQTCSQFPVMTFHNDPQVRILKRVLVALSYPNFLISYERPSSYVVSSLLHWLNPWMYLVCIPARLYNQFFWAWTRRIRTSCWHGCVKILTVNFTLRFSPVFLSMDPTTLKHWLAAWILVKERPVNSAISSSVGWTPSPFARAARAFSIWLVALFTEVWIGHKDYQSGTKWHEKAKAMQVKGSYRNQNASDVPRYQRWNWFSDPVLYICGELVALCMVKSFCAFEHADITCLREDTKNSVLHPEKTVKNEKEVEMTNLN